MAFIQQEPRPFNRVSIEALNPNQNGVYGIFNRDGCIYVGKGDIRSRLLAHLNGDNACITNSNPTHFVTELTVTESQRERELITELSPKCNERLA